MKPKKVMQDSVKRNKAEERLIRNHQIYTSRHTSLRLLPLLAEDAKNGSQAI
jgi:hypothetical protein